MARGGGSRLQTVTVTLRAPDRDRATDREALVAAVASATGVRTGAVRAGRVCPHCSATDHGRPWAAVGDVPVGVSLSRAPGVVALAVGPSSLGVDVERVSRVTAAPLDAFTVRERARARGDGARLAAMWAVKEAVLKRDGRGLRVDPCAVEVDLERAVAVFEGTEHPVTVLFPAADTVLAVAAGGITVTVAA